jgi:hypothetical protein
MTDDLVKRLREDAPRWAREEKWMLAKQLEAAADRIEHLEYALRSIAETPIGAEIPDRTTIWGLAVYMRETATDALKEGKDER